jgi:hypothetical protein
MPARIIFSLALPSTFLFTDWGGGLLTRWAAAPSKPLNPYAAGVRHQAIYGFMPMLARVVAK